MTAQIISRYFAAFKLKISEEDQNKAKDLENRYRAIEKKTRRKTVSIKEICPTIDGATPSEKISR